MPKKYDNEDEFFNKFFDEDTEEEFRNIRRIANALFEKVAKEEIETEQPIIYGFSMRIEDGKPIFRKFGNTQPIIKAKREELSEEINRREPLIDVIEGENTTSITAEIPGVEKKDINLQTTEDSLTISVDTSNTKYHKEIPLPCKINPKSVNATYNNGILDIEFKKTEKKKQRRINIK